MINPVSRTPVSPTVEQRALRPRFLTAFHREGKMYSSHQMLSCIRRYSTYCTMEHVLPWPLHLKWTSIAAVMDVLASIYAQKHIPLSLYLSFLSREHFVCLLVSLSFLSLYLSLPVTFVPLRARSLLIYYTYMYI